MAAEFEINEIVEVPNIDELEFNLINNFIPKREELVNLL